MRIIHVGVVVGAVLLCDPSVTRAHFKLLEPASWLVATIAAIRRKPRRAAVTQRTKARRAIS